MRSIQVLVVHGDKKDTFTFKPKLGKWSVQLTVSDDLTIFIASPPVALPDKGKAAA